MVGIRGGFGLAPRGNFGPALPGNAMLMVVLQLCSRTITNLELQFSMAVTCRSGFQLLFALPLSVRKDETIRA
jgi:hypothetical protein